MDTPFVDTPLGLLDLKETLVRSPNISDLAIFGTMREPLMLDIPSTLTFIHLKCWEGAAFLGNSAPALYKIWGPQRTEILYSAGAMLSKAVPALEVYKNRSPNSRVRL